MDSTIHLLKSLPGRERLLFTAASILYGQGTALYYVEGITRVIVPLQRLPGSNS
jgi:hypothetical protein